MSVTATRTRETVPGVRPDAAYVIARLEEAGAALLALPMTGHSTRMRVQSLEVVSDWLAYPDADTPIRPGVPSARRISEMDEALAWLGLIPADRVVLRRIVGARALVHPVTERHLFPWRRLARTVGADYRAVQRWHADGIDRIVAGLNRPDFTIP